MSQYIRAKKHLGQHFLNDENIAKKIVDSLLECNKGATVIEVGPGTGVLTKYLAPALQNNFWALDVDTDSVPYLKQHYPEIADHVLLQDFLEFDIKSIIPGKFNVVGNFPYNISSQILFKVLDHRHDVDCVVGMFQKEVAMRLAEKPGSKTYGIISVLLQTYYDIEYSFTVNENVFTPPPKVKSAVIRLTRNKRHTLSCNEDLFTKVVKTTFNQRRKQIRNSIRPIITIDDALLPPVFQQRPEQLSVEEFIALTDFVEKHLKSSS
jgi:16S rRNA (adenine1518-N6/adenine1519-N6)-dimethyltransferase